MNQEERADCTVKRPYMRTAPCAVLCRADGNQIAAIIDVDKWPYWGGIAGFGDTLSDALRDLACEIDKEVVICRADTAGEGEEVNERNR